MELSFLYMNKDNQNYKANWIIICAGQIVQVENG